MARRSYSSGERETGLAAPDFDLDDVTFICHGQLSVMDVSELGRLASQGVDSETPEGVGILADLFLSLLGPAEYQRFRKHCREKTTKPELLMQIVGDMIAEFAQRPTTRPSASPAGPPTTEGTARVVSFSRGTVEMAPAMVEPEPKLVSYG